MEVKDCPATFSIQRLGSRLTAGRVGRRMTWCGEVDTYSVVAGNRLARSRELSES
jgi:hypothetical protein